MKDEILNNGIASELARHLDGGMAFTPVKNILHKIPFDKLGIRPKGLPYSFYEVFYHIVYAQKDILDFTTADSYQLPDWPKDYWPKEKQPKDKPSWDALKQSYLTDCESLKMYLTKKGNSLINPVKHASDKEQTLLRETLLVLNHTAYHTAQLLIILRLLDLYK